MVAKETPALDSKSIKTHNQVAWDIAVESSDRWTVPVDRATISKARQGQFSVLLTPNKPVPNSWLGQVSTQNILALASGGGQQGPIFAAAGAKVTVLDISAKQLEQDRIVAAREGLELTLRQGEADDLQFIPSGSIDMVFNPCSSCFFPDLQPVWQECQRVLKPGGKLLTGFNNPIAYCFDFEKANLGQFVMKYPLPFCDLSSFDEAEKAKYLRPQTPIEFSHTLTDQIGSLIQAGFMISGFFEDDWGGSEAIDKYFPQFLALMAIKSSDS